MRLIDADALRDALPVRWESVLRCIREAPTVEAVLVVRGRWTEDETTYPGPGRANYKCSVCGEIGGAWRQGLPQEKLLRYCPWCGARMDEAEGGNEQD